MPSKPQPNQTSAYKVKVSSTWTNLSTKTTRATYRLTEKQRALKYPAAKGSAPKRDTRIKTIQEKKKIDCKVAPSRKRLLFPSAGNIKTFDLEFPQSNSLSQNEKSVWDVEKLKKPMQGCSQYQIVVTRNQKSPVKERKRLQPV